MRLPKTFKTESNKKVATCAICNQKIKAGEGIPAYSWWKRRWYFVHPTCEANRKMQDNK